MQLLLFGGDAYATACTWIGSERIMIASSDGRVLSIKMATPGGVSLPPNPSRAVPPDPHFSPDAV